MDAVDALTRLGGISGSRSLLRLTRRRRLRSAVGRGDVVCVERGRFALPVADAARVAAVALAGVVALRSAAAHHGWALKTPPPCPEVAVGTRRRIAHSRQPVRVGAPGALSGGRARRRAGHHPAGLRPGAPTPATAPATTRS